MNFRDYQNAVLEDATQAFSDGEYIDYETFDEVYEQMFIDDSVTGNGSGSYTFSRYQAEQNTQGLFWDSEFIEVLKDFGYESIPTKDGAEALDVIARCIALSYMSGEIETAWNEAKED